MLKTISAALLAASVIAAPALAAEAGKEASKTAPVIKAEQTQTKAPTAAVKTDAKTDAKAMNANASIAKHEHAKSTRSHRHHQKVAKKHLSTHPEVKPDVPATSGKRS